MLCELLDQAHVDIALVLVHMGKVSQTGALDHVGAGCHRALEGVFHAVGLGTPDGKERSERGITGANGGEHLHLVGVVREPHVLAVGKVRARATQ